MTDHVVITGCAGFIGSRLTDRLLADGHAVVGIDSFEDHYPRAIKEANLKGARANPAFTLHEANILELAAEAASGGLEAGDAEGSALAALLRGCARVNHRNGRGYLDTKLFLRGDPLSPSSVPRRAGR